MSFNPNKPLLIDTLQEFRLLREERAVTTLRTLFEAEGHGGTVPALSSQQIHNQVQVTMAEVIHVRDIADPTVFVFDHDLASAVVNSKIDDPNLVDFTRFPHKKVFINFLQPIEIPSLAKVGQELPPGSKAHALQISIFTREEMAKVFSECGFSNIQGEGQVYASLGAWYDASAEPYFKDAGFKSLLYLNGRLPFHAAKWGSVSCWTAASSDCFSPLFREFAKDCYKFLAYLSSSNITYEKVERVKDKIWPKKGRHPKVTYRQPIYRPFFKDKLVKLYNRSSTAEKSWTLDHQVVIPIGHHAKYHHCPHCLKITPVADVVTSGLCKHCKVGVGTDPNLWQKEWRWIPPHTRGPDVAEQAASARQVKGEDVRYLVKETNRSPASQPNPSSLVEP